MKRNKLALVVALVLFALSAGALAAPHHRGHIGVYVDPWPWYFAPPPYSYYPPYPYYPPVVTVPSEPPTYIEQGEEDAEPAPAQESSYWYYCEKPQGYYPYVRECPGGWQKVPPRPAGQ